MTKERKTSKETSACAGATRYGKTTRLRRLMTSPRDVIAVLVGRRAICDRVE
jgi:hypothetical protein